MLISILFCHFLFLIFFLICPCFHHILVIYSSKLSSTYCSIFAHFWLILFNHNNGQQCSFRIFIFKKNEWVLKKYCKLIETYKNDYNISDIHYFVSDILLMAFFINSATFIRIVMTKLIRNITIEFHSTDVIFLAT